MPDYKLVSLEQMKILAGKTKSYVDGKVGSASDIQSGRFSRILKERSLQRKPRHCRTMDSPSLRMWFTANK